MSTPRLFSEKVEAKLGREGLLSKTISEMKKIRESFLFHLFSPFALFF